MQIQADGFFATLMVAAKPWLDPDPATGQNPPMTKAHHHDHTGCRAGAIDAARRLAEARGVRLTPTRERVLDIVAESHRPIGAYEILERLVDERGRAAPPTVYRALAFLVEQGFAHRIDSLNAFIACFDPERSHDAGFLICDSCKSVEEIAEAALGQAIRSAVSERGFRVSRSVVEISGTCAACAGK
jgi:Fur family zinc uptake transcriptional regulator